MIHSETKEQWYFDLYTFESIQAYNAMFLFCQIKVYAIVKCTYKIKGANNNVNNVKNIN